MMMVNELKTVDASHFCRVCKGSELNCVGEKKSAFSGMDFKLYRCPQCTFQSVSPIIDSHEIYDEDYYQSKGIDPKVNYEEELYNPFHTPRYFEFKNLTQIVEKHKKVKALQSVDWLDYGCGNGALLNFLKKQESLDVHAVGYDKSPFTQTLKDLNLEIYDHKKLQSMGVGRFDVVTCLEVIEHTLDPVEIIADISRLLKPGGLLLLTTGNMDSVVAKLRGFDFSYCVPEIHISLFNAKVLERIYKENGLEPCYFHYSGVVKFKILKNLRPKLRNSKLINFLAGTKIVTWVVDWLFGVSHIPCAVKAEE